MTKEWQPLDNIDFSDKQINQYHIDTRDFCIYISKGKPVLKGVFLTKSKWFYTEGEVKNRVEELYKESGGKGEWRMLSLEGSDDTKNWKMKYIRIFRYKKKLIVCNRSNVPLCREDFFSSVRKEYLMTH